jgi:hypothetical protein
MVCESGFSMVKRLPMAPTCRRDSSGVADEMIGAGANILLTDLFAASCTDFHFHPIISALCSQISHLRHVLPAIFCRGQADKTFYVGPAKKIRRGAL